MNVNPTTGQALSQAELVQIAQTVMSTDRFVRFMDELTGLHNKNLIMSRLIDVTAKERFRLFGAGRLDFDSSKRSASFAARRDMTVDPEVLAWASAHRSEVKV